MSEQNEGGAPESEEALREEVRGEIRDAGVHATKQGGNILILTGILAVVLGLFCLTVATVFTSWMVTLLLGLLIIVGGVLQILSGADMPKKTKGRGWTVFGGILAVIVGLFFVVNPFDGMVILTWIIAVFLLFEGGLRIAAALELKPAEGWGWVLFGGIVAILLGFMLMLSWPDSGLTFIGTLFGVYLLFGGAARITLGMAARKAAKAVEGG